jgi:hypothetical protein
MDALGFDIPAEASFVGSLALAILVLFIQTKTPAAMLPRFVFRNSVGRMLLIFFSVFTFKDVILEGGVVSALAAFAENKTALFCLFTLLPLLTGMLTGFMAGFVGSSLPLLLGLMDQMGLGEQRLIWLTMALICGNLGQMISPLHVCFAVTADFFHVPFAAMWRKIVAPSLLQCLMGFVYTGLLYFFGARA